MLRLGRQRNRLAVTNWCFRNPIILPILSDFLRWPGIVPVQRGLTQRDLLRVSLDQTPKLRQKIFLHTLELLLNVELHVFELAKLLSRGLVLQPRLPDGPVLTRARVRVLGSLRR